MLSEWVRSVQTRETNIKEEWMRKGRYLLVILVCIGILALIWPVTDIGQHDAVSPPEPVYQQEDVKGVKAQMEEELASILSQIEGAGKVDVSLTLSSDGVKTYAANVREEKKDYEENSGGGKKVTSETNIAQDIAVNAGSALLIEHKNPEVVGVLVVAEGAGDARVREDLSWAAATLLDVPIHKVKVMPMQEGRK
ncbi:stage III sporulation protein AG [Thermosyntropha lipolytica DSM 11003]|uniref:Stage III sporulation protein AG n=1 Tax=Thermosyntropha lipolytica DSM 11003 TaxID=1123382 RepID=A0A1M5LKH7_9FIRM|nr:hypothetical protein [Thermosyntropha lipolytica]SHG65189.1 stage III sporulation protein AG [Thermosyntropha lipolytica DSM 11003]